MNLYELTSNPCYTFARFRKITENRSFCIEVISELRYVPKVLFWDMASG